MAKQLPTDLSGKLLIAHPSLRDPNFRRCILILSNHSREDGAFGLVINRPTAHVLTDFLADRMPPLDRVAVYQGGPVGTNELTLVAFFQEPDSKNYLCRTHLTLDEAAELVSAGEGLVRAYRGYAGWSPGQLESEIGQNAWFLGKPSRELVEQDLNETNWVKVVSELGPIYHLWALAPDDPSLN